MYYVYVIKSTKDGNLYIGSTNDLKKRLWEHSQGLNKSTKSRRPFFLVYYEACLAESDARKREHALKKDGRALAQLKRRISQSLKAR